MYFRIISKQIALVPAFQTSRWLRRFGAAAMICGCIGTVAHAQSSLDFIDPLSEERTRIEAREGQPSANRPAPAPREESAAASDSANLLARARESANSSAAAAQDQATGFWGKIRAALSGIGDAIGVSTLGLMGILTALLAGIALLVGWTVFRSKKRIDALADADDLYATPGKKAFGRRSLEDSPPSADPKDNRATAQRDTAPNAFDEMESEDFDSIFAEESTPRAARAKPPKSDDASKWRKPNLDRLRDSIKSDWKAGKQKPDSGDATAAMAATAASAAGAMASSDPGERPLTDISDGWEEWDEQVSPENDPWGETLAKAEEPAADPEDSAMSRIRALRESLRAS